MSTRKKNPDTVATNSLDAVLLQAQQLMQQLQTLLPSTPPTNTIDWQSTLAARWRRSANALRHTSGHLQAVMHVHQQRMNDLLDVDAQKKQLDRNTQQFVAGLPANNVLLSGARGTGKSSLIRALLGAYAKHGLRLIEIGKQDLIDLPDLVEVLGRHDYRFIVFCDDLSFEEGEPGYTALKSVLDGSVSAVPENVLIYATSNRRHLMPEYMDENLQTRHIDGEVHPGEATEEKISLSERFGLWLSFYPFSQDSYLDIANHWLRNLGVPASEIEGARTDALQWALQRGSRSGRVAAQFARDYAGRYHAAQTKSSRALKSKRT